MKFYKAHNKLYGDYWGCDDNRLYIIRLDDRWAIAYRDYKRELYLEGEFRFRLLFVAMWAARLLVTAFDRVYLTKEIRREKS